MVSEIKRASTNLVSDTITYGIDPETFEIVTPIWSELQQRYIDIYTDKQVDKIQEKNPFTNVKKFSLVDNTIYFEIEKYLNILSGYFERTRTDKMYLDFFDSEINEDFVKKFVRK